MFYVLEFYLPVEDFVPIASYERREDADIFAAKRKRAGRCGAIIEESPEQMSKRISGVDRDREKAEADERYAKEQTAQGAL